MIADWHAERAESRRPANVRELWEHLACEYGYGGSYQSVLRYVRTHYPKPKMRTYRRVETPPGAWGTIYPTDRAYTDTVGFHIDACSPREPWAKGEVEAKVKLGRDSRLDPTRRRHDGLEGLQAWTDEGVEDWTRRATCPATGETVHECW